jgi:hypothetical protein
MWAADGSPLTPAGDTGYSALLPVPDMSRMRRRRLLTSVGLVLGFLALVLVGLVVAVKREPSFYTQADIPEGYVRQTLSQEAVGEFARGRFALERDEPDWRLEFTAQQLNAYFQQDYHVQGGDENLPEALSAPRVKFEDGRMRFGVRYGRGLFSTVLSVEVKAWLVPGLTNVMALEFVSLKAGSLPLSPASLIDRFSEAVRRENIDVTWYRNDGHPVAVMRFQADLTRPTLQFDRLELKDNSLMIAGRSADLLTTPAPPPRVVENK